MFGNLMQGKNRQVLTRFFCVDIHRHVLGREGIPLGNANTMRDAFILDISHKENIRAAEVR